MFEEETLTYNQTAHAITEFIEVAIHAILYVRQVYPAQIFVRRKKYDTPVYQSRHPILNDYIAGAVKAVGDELETGNLDKVIIVIKNKEEIPLERFIFSVDTMIDVEGFNRDTGVEDAMTPSSLSTYFRSFMIKLNMVESQIGQMHLGDDISFAVLIELKDDAAPTHSNTKDPPPWIPAATQQTSSGAGPKADVHMIRAVNTGIINVSNSVTHEAHEKVVKREQEEKEKKMKEKQRQRELAQAAKAKHKAKAREAEGQQKPLVEDEVAGPQASEKPSESSEKTTGAVELPIPRPPETSVQPATSTPAPNLAAPQQSAQAQRAPRIAPHKADDDKENKTQ